MADTKTSALTAITTAGGDELLYIVDDPGGTPVSRKITVDNLSEYFDDLTQTLTNKTIDAANNTVSLTADSVDAITEIAAALKSGADLVLITGTAGTADDLAIWNADGDLVDGPTPPAGAIVGTTDTQSLTNKTLGATTLSGAISAADNNINRAVFKDYGEEASDANGQLCIYFFQSTSERYCWLVYAEINTRWNRNAHRNMARFRRLGKRHSANAYNDSDNRKRHFHIFYR